MKTKRTKWETMVMQIAALLLLGLVLVGCPTDGGNDNPDKETIAPVVYSSGDVELKITKTQADLTKAAGLPASGDWYLLKHKNVEISRGTITVSGTDWIFKQSIGKLTSDITAAVVDGTLVFINDIEYTDGSETKKISKGTPLTGTVGESGGSDITVYEYEEEGGQKTKASGKVYTSLWDNDAERVVDIEAGTITNGSLILKLPALSRGSLDDFSYFQEGGFSYASSGKNITTNISKPTLNPAGNLDMREISMFVYNPNGNSRYIVEESERHRWWYVTRDCTIDGINKDEITRDGILKGTTIVEFKNLVLKKGWNTVYRITTEDREIISNTPPSGLRWEISPDQGSEVIEAASKPKSK